ncbi:hypothetical protein QFZ63_001589 [Streptomyces sp. B3I7]|uniref:hypothetical protein n=1 Tax=Streptomyces sp. B3I7 TaxID=3042269 RepID=UPI0027843B9A|nr:hypothetical protein [Streptomyces sp. B3I7]MDQ0809875.1 hypothetical protein [Streptomyces sp. B3I7]
MPNSQQSRPLTTDGQLRMLFERTAKLNDKVSALLNPAWGSEMGIIPIDHPLYQGQKPSAAQEEQAAPVDWQAIARQRERELKTEGERKHAAQKERDGAYRERAHLVALLAAMTGDAVIAPALDVPEPGWWIVYLTIGGRQTSWHISPRDAVLFAHVEHVDVEDSRAIWDGHSTEEKYAAITAHTAELAQR